MRIASLVPSSTEMLFALGLGEGVVAVTHECDHPPAVLDLPRLTRTVVPAGLSSGEIDQTVKRVVGEGRPLYELDEALLAEAGPELIVTQAVCEVCAVSYDDVVAVAGRLPGRPLVISQDPMTLADVLDDALRLGEAADVPSEAAALRARLEERIGAVSAAVAGARRPRVLALEWLDPPFVGGHWVPEMIEAAGGTDAAGEAGARSREAGWEELRRTDPEVVVAMPCGYHVEDSASEARGHAAPIGSLGAERVFAVDAASSFSRPGPRLAEGVELLGHLLHPERVAPPSGIGFAEV